MICINDGDQIHHAHLGNVIRRFEPITSSCYLQAMQVVMLPETLTSMLGLEEKERNVNRTQARDLPLRRRYDPDHPSKLESVLKRKTLLLCL